MMGGGHHVGSVLAVALSGSLLSAGGVSALNNVASSLSSVLDWLNALPYTQRIELSVAGPLLPGVTSLCLFQLAGDLFQPLVADGLVQLR